MKPQSNLKKIIGIVGIVIAIAGLTVAALLFFAPKKEAAKEEQPEVTVSAKDIIDAIQKPETLPELQHAYAKPETQNLAAAAIVYTKQDSFTITQPASDAVQYTLNDVDSEKNNEAVVAQVQAYLESKGLRAMPATNSAIYIVFDSDKTVCQIVSLPKNQQTRASLTISCVSKDTIDKAYSDIKQFSTLYEKATNETFTPAAVRTQTFSEDNISLMVIDAYNKDGNGSSLLFGSIDGEKEYLGKRALSAGTTETQPNGIDRSLSNELKEKIADPKYGDFLKKYIN